MVILFNPLVLHFCCANFVHILQNVINTIISASFYVYFKDILCDYAEIMMNVSVTYNLRISAQQNGS